MGVHLQGCRLDRPISLVCVGKENPCAGIEKSPFSKKELGPDQENGVPEGIRTPDRALRRRMLYPTELPGQLGSRTADAADLEK
ncbi:hypothetical protein BN871_BS_00250 [Paenibacillus sp. P22]|nr:hypothetical protein BN871_BS_00250 [Paenibacillus sp. P22]